MHLQDFQCGHVCEMPQPRVGDQVAVVQRKAAEVSQRGQSCHVCTTACQDVSDHR